MSAVISECGLYRYRLTRTWDPAVQALGFVMLNPSTADAEIDDPTIRRCVGFARDWGFGGIAVANLYAFRATKPADLWLAADPVGPENDEHLAALFTTPSVGMVVAAWGANARPDRVAHVASLPGAITLHALGLTKDGAPRHPLYMPKTAQPQPWAAS
jgi:hypothetical protein